MLHKIENILLAISFYLFVSYNIFIIQQTMYSHLLFYVILTVYLLLVDFDKTYSGLLLYRYLMDTLLL